MTIKEVCEKYNIKPDTLRYYERVGVIPIGMKSLRRQVSLHGNKVIML